MPKQDDFAMLDFYALILALGGWIVLLVGLFLMIFTFTAAGLLAGLATLPTLVSGIALLAAAKLLRCALAIHRDTRAMRERMASTAE